VKGLTVDEVLGEGRHGRGTRLGVGESEIHGGETGISGDELPVVLVRWIQIESSFEVGAERFVEKLLAVQGNGEAGIEAGTQCSRAVTMSTVGIEVGTDPVFERNGPVMERGRAETTSDFPSQEAAIKHLQFVPGLQLIGHNP
tara:strand:+ start:136 stop:564 length:429 start_codon:yes stop_codon:yes gene_type:complete